MGRKVSEKGKVIRAWIKANPDGKFKDFERVHPGITTGAYFSNAKTRLKNPGTRGPGKSNTVRVERNLMKKLTSQEPPAPASPKKAEPEAKPVRAPIQYASDAGLILEAAVKVWIAKDTAMIQLRTITNSILNEYRYIQSKIKG